MADETASMIESPNAVPVGVTVEINDASKALSKTENAKEQDSSLSNLFKNLSLDARNNIMLLRKLQMEQIEHEVKFYNERHILDMKYEKMYIPLFEKRREIATGTEELKKEMLTEGIEGSRLQSEGKNAVIDRFWLIVFLNSNTLSKEIHPGDETILQHLIDVRRRYIPEGSMNFVLEFHFEHNEYFTNTVLTKEYDVSADIDEDDPYGYDGPRIIKCRGCVINWKEGKNPTTKTIRKKKVKWSSVATKVVKRNSFFNFFSPPVVPKDGVMDEYLEEILMDDFEIGEYIKERIIPRAVLYYTKEVDSESDESEEDDSHTDSSEELEEKSGSQLAKSKRKGQS